MQVRLLVGRRTRIRGGVSRRVLGRIRRGRGGIGGRSRIAATDHVSSKHHEAKPQEKARPKVHDCLHYLEGLNTQNAILPSNP